MVTSAPALHLGRDAVGVGQGLRPPGRARVPRGRHRLRHQAQHPAPARRQRLQGDGGAGARPSADDIVALKPDGVFLSNGPGDPAATGEYAVPVIREHHRQRHPDLRHLPRPPDARHRGRRQDDEDAPGPPRRQPSGEGPHHRQGRDHLDEPRLRGRPRDACRRTPSRRMCRCSTARIAASRSRTSRCSRCSTTRRPRPARATATICSSGSWR